MQNRLGDLIQPPLEIMLLSGIFRRERRAVFVFDSNHDSGNNV